MAAKKAKAKVVKDSAKLSKATIHDFDIIIEPVLTEKSMALMQEQNKVTVKVSKKANRADIKKAFERVFQVSVEDVNIVNVSSKDTRRGGRYNGTIPGFKKAIVTLKDGEALDLFKE